MQVKSVSYMHVTLHDDDDDINNNNIWPQMDF